MNGSTLPPSVSRRLSRSNSTSSSNVSTVKHFGGKIGHRKSISQARPTSSDSINQHFTTLDAAAAAQARPNRAQEAGPSSSLNINRWSHSTSSSMGAVDGEFLRQISRPTSMAAVKHVKGDSTSRAPIIPKSQFSWQVSESTSGGASPARSPVRPKGASKKTSYETGLSLRPQSKGGRASPFATTPDAEKSLTRSNSNDYFGTLLDHSRGANKFGQPVEGIALQMSSGSLRARRPEQNKMTNIHQATNSSHISLQQKPSHTRRRDESEPRNGDLTGGSISSIKSEHSRRSGHRSPAQKNMLSQALSKANQAVLLDNAQQISGAIEAYIEACEILEQVLSRSSDGEDRKKLSAIRATYSARIAELYDLDNSFDHLRVDKELPEAPATTKYLDGQDRISFEDPDDFEPATAPSAPNGHMQLPLRQESLLPQIFGGERFMDRSPSSDRLKVPGHIDAGRAMDAKFMPPPLSPRRGPSPSHTDDQLTPQAHAPPTDYLKHRISTGSTSWLDTFEEPMSSRVSSVNDLRHDQALVSAIEAELDAAVDAAYDDYDDDIDGTTLPAQHNVARAQQLNSNLHDLDEHYLDHGYADEDAEQEEEMLEMMMAERFLDNDARMPGNVSSPPGQSHSSMVSARSSGRTWDSSMTAATQGTSLSTLAEGAEKHHHDRVMAPSPLMEEAEEDNAEAEQLMLKQVTPLPPLPPTDKPSSLPLRDRRLSGQTAAQLKIETFSRQGSVDHHTTGPTQLLDIPGANVSHSQHPTLPRTISGTNISVNTPLASIHSAGSTDSPGTPILTQLLSNSTAGDELDGQTDGHRMPPPIRGQGSSSNLRPRELSLTTHDLQDLPATPGSALFPSYSRSGSVATPATATTMHASPNVLTSNTVGGMYVFDHIGDAVHPSSPRSFDGTKVDPYVLEPCPQSSYLRPFWLMRSLYNAFSNPRGGYLSTKLFIPRDIWRVKGIKIKGIDDKTAQCDFLTAALLKLAKVDTLDADAVLDELNQFDTIIQDVRTNLGKKLGNEVGNTSGAAAAIKQQTAEENENKSGMKSLASSWKKLRSKSSTPALAAQAPRKESIQESMASLPMTSSAEVSTSRSFRAQRHPPPTPTALPHIPVQHASYISSLARLFDAVQVLDSIARQVEDPGLKASNPTQVGLELAISNAAEFFSFYILRFVLADVGMFLDKYLKRNSEWMML